MSRAVPAVWSNVVIVQQNLSYFCGDDVVVTFTSQDIPPVSTTGWTLAAYLRKNPGISQPVLVTWPGTPAGTSFTIAPASADTLNLTPGQYDLEVSRIDSGAYAVLTRVQLTLLPR
jgi:hypothetical protein